MKTTYIISLIICFLMIAAPSEAQNMMRRPFLEVSNNHTHQKFRIRPGKKIVFKTLRNDTLRSGRIEKINYTSLLLKSGEVVPFSQITLISFTPVSISGRTLKTVWYSFYTIGLLSAARGFYTSSGSSVPYSIFLMAAPVVILAGETAGGLVQLLTPRETIQPIEQHWQIHAVFKYETE